MAIEDSRNQAIAALSGLDLESISEASKLIVEALKNGKKVLSAGNGGSAADSQHFAGELVCTFEVRGRKGLRAVSLNTNTSILTAWSNDFSFDSVFARQVDALGDEGDILFSITTSGNSRNIINAMKAARKKMMKNILLTGRDGGEAKELADVAIIVPNNSTARIQECHIFSIHGICTLVDESFGGGSNQP